MRIIVFAFILLLVCSVALRAEDWTTADGRTTYKNVKILSHDDAYVTILDEDGGGRVALSSLTPDLQKKFGFDPVKAAACATATAAADKAEQAAIIKEEQQQETAVNLSLAEKQQATPAGAVTSTTSSSAPTPEVDQFAALKQREIQTQIANLQQDISMMENELAKTNDRSGEGGAYVSGGQVHQVSHGGYADRIADDQSQIKSLQAQLQTTSQGGTASAPTAPSTSNGSSLSGAFANVPRL